jgi:hypothetical protein
MLILHPNGTREFVPYGVHLGTMFPGYREAAVHATDLNSNDTPLNYAAAGYPGFTTTARGLKLPVHLRIAGVPKEDPLYSTGELNVQANRIKRHNIGISMPSFPIRGFFGVAICCGISSTTEDRTMAGSVNSEGRYFAKQYLNGAVVNGVEYSVDKYMEYVESWLAVLNRHTFQSYASHGLLMQSFVDSQIPSYVQIGDHSFVNRAMMDTRATESKPMPTRAVCFLGCCYTCGVQLYRKHKVRCTECNCVVFCSERCQQQQGIPHHCSKDSSKLTSGKANMGNMSNLPACVVCGTEATDEQPMKFCPCYTEMYCGIECQKAHWRDGHKQLCAAAKKKE